MEEMLEALVSLALAHFATDIHLCIRKSCLEVSLRTGAGIECIRQDIFGPPLFEYLKYRAGLDLTHPFRPQSGQFVIGSHSCRFAVIKNPTMETGVLRILQAPDKLTIEDLSSDSAVTDYFKKTAARNRGLVLFVGPTGSGKTTTQHAILRYASQVLHQQCVSLEDPVEIPDPAYLQLQVNEEAGFTYEVGIQELLRHAPNIICIGETRSAYVCQKMFTASLTGHAVLSTIHAGDGLECLLRLQDLGIDEKLILSEVAGIVSQRLVCCPDGRKECIYEIVGPEEIEILLRTGKYPAGFVRLSEKTARMDVAGNHLGPMAVGF